MKTSKIIFISLLSIIALFILAVFIDIRINGHRNGMAPANNNGYKMDKKTVPSFKVLCVNNCTSINVVQNDSSFIEATSLKDSPFPHLNYTIKDDTLIVSDIKLLDQNNKHMSVRIYSTDSLKRILLKNSGITIENFVSDKMSLDINKSAVSFSQGTSFFGTLNILAKNHSQISASEFNVDSLGIVLHNSEANLEITAKKLYGTLSDSSRIEVKQPAEISLKKDATSKVNISDN